MSVPNHHLAPPYNPLTGPLTLLLTSSAPAGERLQTLLQEVEVLHNQQWGRCVTTAGT